MRLEALWKQRSNAYFKAVMPYWRYVMSSGGAAMGFAFILAIQGYATLLSGTRASGEADTWLPAYAAAALAFSLLWNPVRTYFARPDLIFLLPMEARMPGYLRGAWRRGATMSVLATAALILLYWPLYQAASTGTATNYALAAVFLLAIKGMMYYGAWRERQFRYRLARWVFLAVKAFAAVVSAYLWFRGGMGLPAILGICVVWIAYAAALRLPAAYPLHWERLLTEERRTIARHEAWFGFFVDLPHREETYKPRAYLNGLLRWIRYERKNAFLYMYWRSFVRSSLFVFTLRLIVLEALMIWIFPTPWVAVGIYAIFTWLMGLQLRGLRAAPSELLLAAISPLPRALRGQSQRAVQRVSNLIGVLLMAIPVALVAPVTFAVGCVIAGLGSAILFATGRTNGV
jgi:ABC-2 type transport system permease protein